MNTLKVNRLVPIAFTNIYIIWGATFLAVSYGLQGFPPFVLCGLRFLTAGFILLGWLTYRGEKATSLENWKKNAVTGILVLTGGTGLVAWGEQYVTSTEAAISIATGPFWFIAIDKKNWNYYFSDKFILTGLIAGFAGLIVFLNGSIQAESYNLVPANLRIAAFVVLALSSVSWVLGSLYSKNNPSSHSTIMNITQQLISAGVAAFIIASIKGEWFNFSIQSVPLASWLGYLFLVFFGSIVAYLSYIWLLSVRPGALVSTHTYINPIVAIIIGWIFLGNTITGDQLTGLLVILSGVLLTNMKSYIKLSNRDKVKIRRTYRYLFGISRPQTPKFVNKSLILIEKRRKNNYDKS